MVTRLADYRWSSYRAYAYGEDAPEWLATELILGQLTGNDWHKNYREKVQRYSKEEKRLWEYFWHGTFLGSKKFVEKIRRLYLPETPHSEIPTQKELAGSIDPDTVLKKAAKSINCNLKHLVRSNRIFGVEKDNRDLLIYFIWKNGSLTNEKIGALFGLTYSSVSHSIRSVKSRLKKDGKLKAKFVQLSRVEPRCSGYRRR
jgi:hypothetical protein